MYDLIVSCTPKLNTSVRPELIRRHSNDGPRGDRLADDSSTS